LRFVVCRMKLEPVEAGWNLKLVKVPSGDG
jgi:hypothetical protein